MPWSRIEPSPIDRREYPFDSEKDRTSVLGGRMEGRAGRAKGDAAAPPRLSPSLVLELPSSVARPAYDRAALKPGLAHLGVGAFHRCHQEDFTDDLLAHRSDRWGVVGINVR